MSAQVTSDQKETLENTAFHFWYIMNFVLPGGEPEHTTVDIV